MSKTKLFVESTVVPMHNDYWEDYDWKDGDQILVELYDPESDTFMHIVGLFIEDLGKFQVLAPDGAFGLDELEEMYPEYEVPAWQLQYWCQENHILQLIL